MLSSKILHYKIVICFNLKLFINQKLKYLLVKIKILLIKLMKCYYVLNVVNHLLNYRQKTN